MSNFTSKEIVQELVESTRDNRWFVNTKTIGTQVGHRNFPPLTVQRHVTEAVKRLSAKQKKIAAMDGDKDEIDADDLAKLRSMKENNDSHTHAAHFNNSKGEWSGMALIDAKDDDDAIAQAHQISAGNKWKDFKLSGVERHVPVKEEAEQMDEGKYASTIAAIASAAYQPKVGDKIRTRIGGQIPGEVTKVTDTHVHFKHPEGKTYKTSVSNVMRSEGVVEEAEQIDEISTKLASNYADKAWSSGDDKRAKGLNLAIRKMASRGAKVSTTMEDNKKPNYNTFAGATYRPPNTSKDRRDPKDHKHEYDLARRVDNPLRKKVEEEIEQIDEGSAHSIVNNLKSDGKHQEAGAKAFEHGLGRKYGQHFGLRSTKDKDEASFHRGYDQSEAKSKKKVDEEVEQISELKKATLASYAAKRRVMDTKGEKNDRTNLALNKIRGGDKPPFGLSKWPGGKPKVAGTNEEVELSEEALMEAGDAAQRAWHQMHTKGTKAGRERLDKVHAKNPAYQAFKKSLGTEGGEKSVKQASKAPENKPAEKSSDGKKPLSGIRAVNAARVKAAMEKGTAHRSAGVGSAGTTANLSPLEKKVGDVNKLEKKKTTTALGASPTEREVEIAKKKEAPKPNAVERKPARLTGKVGI